MGEWRRREKEPSGGTLAVWAPEYQQVVAVELRDIAVASSGRWQGSGASDYGRWSEEHDRINAVPTKALLQSRDRVSELRELGTWDDPTSGEGPTLTLPRLEESDESFKIIPRYHVNMVAEQRSAGQGSEGNKLEVEICRRDQWPGARTARV